MKQTKIMMGMTITIEITDKDANEKAFDEVFSYFDYIDKKFSTYKDTTEISLINQGKLSEENFSEDMKEVLRLSEKTKLETKGYFDIQKADGTLDPSGLVKGWMILKAAEILKNRGFKNFYIDAGGDIQVEGKKNENETWDIGIRNPFNPEKQVVKIFYVSGKGVATSGTYARGQHIYDPHKKGADINEIVSLTVIGPNIYEADRFATAAFAMGKLGIYFIEDLPGFEGYMIDSEGLATETSGLGMYLKKQI